MINSLASICVLLAVASAAWGSKTCLNSLDVVLVVEDTNMLPDAASETVLKNFLARVVNHLNLGVHDAQVAFQTYNDESTTQFNLNKYTETTDARGAILTTPFTRKTTDAPSVGKALNYAVNNILTVQNGERSCFPTVVILVSYSSYSDPNGVESKKDPDVSVARLLRNSGALVLALGVGPNRNPNLLINVAGGNENYFDLNSFSDLSDALADDIANRTCNYKPSSDFYPCEMETIAADLIFVVDVSKKMSENYTNAVLDFIKNYLKPYQFGKENIQAALVTYSKVADVAVPLTAASSYSKFIQMAEDALSGSPFGTERYIYNALDTVLYHVLTENNGFRPAAAHHLFVFSGDCFTGPDPVATAHAIRAKQTSLYMITLGSPFGFWKETLDIAGDPQNLFEVPTSPEVILPNFLPKVAWRLLCAADTAPTTTTTGPGTTGAPTAAPTTGAPTSAPTTGAPTSAPTTGAPTSAPTTGAPTSAPTTTAPIG